ncbi:MAG: TRAP transporter large permease subunit [Gammaproteobacteria bacterium]|nr:TRAP transporter large permease subunit [Gammaproteobacteria bacterium]MBU0850491.1 TRAP transporter large permease subunit [Gammaproteobacteria bacterium]MBU1267125.1 TRAP transporter large permease subunit [Gammaproteobacteria bacterium]MBU1529510.1 TRAP transporter large permease subunit [Gammaproteobacteria bacterium]MBU1780503.1 TRAP transporter large permease subunit [Gammaproteobacteria bacterium]
MPIIPLEWLPPIMFAVLLVFMVSGFPVAFALAANGLLFGYVAIEQGLMSPALLQALPDRIFGIMSNDTLLAIPFFTFMGLVLERSGMAEDLLETIGQLFGRVRGGLAYAVILVGALLAATTGVVAASVISMGLISLPVMLKYGYSKPVATGVIAASGTLAQILPPSLVLIVLGDQLGVSVGEMYKGAMLPALMLVGLFMLYVFAVTRLQQGALPALPPDVCTFGSGNVGLRKACAVLFVLVPPVALIFLVLGTIFLGIATPTEGGAMGAVGALVLAYFKKRLNLGMLKQSIDSTTKLSCFVLFILIGSTVFGLTFRAVEGDLWIEHLMGDLPGGELGFLMAVQILIFVLGFFLDFFEIAFIVIPLLVPVADKLSIDMVWFGVMIAMNMQTSFLTPPFGFSLFYLRSVAPKVIKTIEIYKGSMPFIAMQIIMVAVIFIFPEVVTREKKVKLEDKPLSLELPTQNYGDENDLGGNQPFVPQFSE